MRPDKVKERALVLQDEVNAEIARRWPDHNPWTYERMVDDMATRALDDNWEYTVTHSIHNEDEPARIFITRYNGPIDYSKEPTNA